VEQRKGFTLIELMVALAVLSILIYMAFASFSIVSAVSASNQNREAVLEDMSTVLDQLTKELRQTVTSTASTSFMGVDLPVYSSSVNAVRGLTGSTTILSTSPPSPQPGAGQPYVFGVASDTAANDTRTILRFYTQGGDGVYRISYTLGVPAAGAGAISQAYWPKQSNQSYQPCQVWYTREKWNDTDADGVVDSGELTAVVSNQPVTGQVITNFTVIRPAWSDNVIQIVLQAMVRNGSGGGSTTITRIAQISLRQ